MSKLYSVIGLYFFLLTHIYAKSAGFPFVENKNQWPTSVKYRVELPNGFLFLHQNSLQYSFYETSILEKVHANLAKKDKERKTEPLYAKSHSFTVDFEGANLSPTLVAKMPFAWKQNYFLGDDPQKWATNVSSYEEITYENLYKNIDLKLYSKNNTLKYEFIVAAKTPTTAIKMTYNHTDKLWINENGNLVIQTSVGEMQESKPYSYQMINGKLIEIPSKFQLDNNQVTFVFPEGYNEKYPLVIDPAIIFATYSGGESKNYGYTSATDADGNFYSAGEIIGSNFPTTQGAFQINFGGGLFDIILSKYNATGTQLLFATFLGGNSHEEPTSLVITKNQEIYIVGSTESINLPMLANSFDKTFANDDLEDGFIVKLNVNGSQLLAATFLGNKGFERIEKVLLDEQENVYAVGTTASLDFPVKNAFQDTNKGSQDIFITKLFPDLSNLHWSTYLGGTKADFMYHASATFFNQKIYIGGETKSLDLPTTPGVLFPNFQGGSDAFVSIISTDGQLEHLSYLGSGFTDSPLMIDTDINGNVYILGQTGDKNYPTTPGVFKQAKGRIFIHKLDPLLAKTIYATTLAIPYVGNGFYPITGFVVSDCEAIYVSASTDDTLITTPDALKKFPSTKFSYDQYLIVLEKDAKSMIYATYIGGDNTDDHNHGISFFDKKGILYYNLCVGGLQYPTTPGVVFPNKPNEIIYSQVATKIDASLPNLAADFQVLDPLTLQPIQKGCDVTQVLLKYQGPANTSLIWEVNGVIVAKDQSEVLVDVTEIKLYNFKLTAENPATCNQQVIIDKPFDTEKVDITVSKDAQICPGEATQLSATGGISFSWSPSEGLDNPNIANPLASPLQNTTYTVAITTKGGCQINKNVKVEILPEIKIDFDAAVVIACGKMPELHLINRTEGADNFKWNLGNGDILEGIHPPNYVYPQAGEYEVTLTASSNSCSVQQAKKVKILAQRTEISNVITPNNDGKNENLILPYENCAIEIYNRWGKLLYKKDNYANEWGNSAENALYYYIITLPGGSKCNGWLQVMR